MRFIHEASRDSLHPVHVDKVVHVIVSKLHHHMHVNAGRAHENMCIVNAHEYIGVFQVFKAICT